MKNWLFTTIILGLGIIFVDAAAGGNAKSQGASAPAAVSVHRGGGAARPSGANAGVSSRSGAVARGHYPGVIRNQRIYGQAAPRLNRANSNRALVYPPVRNPMVRQHVPSKGAAPYLTGNRNSANATNTARSRQKVSRKGQGVNAAPLNRPKVGAQAQQNQFSRGKLDPQTRVRLRNWTGSRATFAEARGKNWFYRHHHHDHHWWRRHCPVIIFWNWGFWGWYGGWWYPAWGYDPYYSYYDYGEPIYGYGGLAPEEIISNVQSALQELGYYNGPIDGLIGDLTRAAIASFQRDNGLEVTGAIDEATLAALGLVNS